MEGAIGLGQGVRDDAAAGLDEGITDGIEAHAASSEVGDTVRGGKSGFKDGVADVVFRGKLPTEFGGALPDFIEVETTAIVLKYHLVHVAVRPHVELDDAELILAPFLPNFGLLDAVDHGIANEVRQNFPEEFEMFLRQLGILDGGIKDGRFTDALADFGDEPGE